MSLIAGLIGAHISRTRLPAALQILCDEHGMGLEFYLIDTAEKSEFDFDATVHGLRNRGWTGVTVTHPFKTNAARYAEDGMHPEVEHLGACNTLVFGEYVTGFNTDYTGFLAAMEPVDEIGSVVMAGAGGVARALGAALVKRGARDIAIYDTDRVRAEDLAFSLGPPARAIPSDALAEAMRLADGLVNATPLGMAEYPGAAFDLSLLDRQGWAFDAVYTPTDTAFLQAASAAGLQIFTGFDLFRHMAIRSFAAYTGLEVEPEDFLPLLEDLRP
ncbi:shikimate dehydrogenase [Litoreibacter ponti]|uniref:Shikimate dehydrogenase n=1 Tax=Litoreibacter ponti TaxID=1510457 RepID=A0A2T6BDT1_9RHOB|nr:shikimate dehydrogenase [Litoreibacter ponti]PTX54220.1 shikimate dehydrogenase [Litoreibacter ponti]